MKASLSYHRKIFLYFSAIIIFFTVIVVVFEQSQLKKERIHQLESTMDIYAETVHAYIRENNLHNGSNLQEIERILKYLPNEVRVSIIDWKGNVLYDNALQDGFLGNHLSRPEVQKALKTGSGSEIRVSTSTHLKYLYYAKRFNALYFVRIAMPFDQHVVSVLKSGRGFLYFMVLFFVACILMMRYFANRFSKSLQDLRLFSQRLKNGETIPSDIVFEDDEIGKISADIIENYKLLQKNRRQTVLEREKLLQHFHYSEEGIALFSSDKKNFYINSHILQYLNVIFDTSIINIEHIFEEEKFDEIVRFLNTTPRSINVFTKQFENNGKKFNVRVIVFDDESFELYVSDITKAEKTRLLKQEMTNNIAHELSTPVTSIRGYIETILNLKEEDVARRNGFLERAHAQTMRLTELIQDISLLTKIEEAPGRFNRENVNMLELLEEIRSDMEDDFKKKDNHFTIEIPANVAIRGNRTLLYSIFRNLVENTLAYAGDAIQVVVRYLNTHDNSLHFEYYDNGVGIEDKHLIRIFERFYRVNEGRTRTTGGGSGLGLSIVKNAVLFHHGNIVAKNRPEGGLAFFITFPKDE